MKICIPARISRESKWGRIALIAGALAGIASCSKTGIHLADQPNSEPMVLAANTAAQKTAADRLVEIDRLLATPPTGRPEESDRRTALRAEQEALIASGEVPYRNVPSSFMSRVANMSADNTVTQRFANGNVINNALPMVRTETINTQPVEVVVRQH